MIDQSIRSSNIDLEHGNQCDSDTCCEVFVDAFTTVQNSKNQMLNDTCACPIMETEPVNQGTDVLQDESQVNSNLRSDTSDRFPDCPEKKSGYVLKLKLKFNRKAVKISQSQKPQFANIKKGRQAKSISKSQEGRGLSKNCSKFHKPMRMKRVNKKTKLDAKCKHVLKILKFGYALTSNFGSLSDKLPLPLRFLLNKPRVKIKYK